MEAPVTDLLAPVEVVLRSAVEPPNDSPIKRVEPARFRKAHEARLWIASIFSEKIDSDEQARLPSRALPPQNFWKNVAIAAAAKLGMAWGSPGLTHQTTG